MENYDDKEIVFIVQFIWKRIFFIYKYERNNFRRKPCSVGNWQNLKFAKQNTGGADDCSEFDFTANLIS